MATNPTKSTAQTARDVSKELEYLTRALKAPTLRESIHGWLNGHVRKGRCDARRTGPRFQALAG